MKEFIKEFADLLEKHNVQVEVMYDCDGCESLDFDKGQYFGKNFESSSIERMCFDASDLRRKSRSL